MELGLRGRTAIVCGASSGIGLATAEALAAEGMVEQRWWARAELEAARAVFAPRRLPELVGDLLRHGPPPQPIDAGV